MIHRTLHPVGEHKYIGVKSLLGSIGFVHSSPWFTKYSIKDIGLVAGSQLEAGKKILVNWIAWWFYCLKLVQIHVLVVAICHPDQLMTHFSNDMRKAVAEFRSVPLVLIK
eukprot:5154332-Amphidinium_carterae.1